MNCNSNLEGSRFFLVFFPFSNHRLHQLILLSRLLRSIVKKLSNREKTNKKQGVLGGFKGGFRGLGGRIVILEQYAKRIIIIRHHTKFELNSSKRLEVIPS